MSLFGTFAGTPHPNRFSLQVRVEQWLTSSGLPCLTLIKITLT